MSGVFGALLGSVLVIHQVVMFVLLYKTYKKQRIEANL